MARTGSVPVTLSAATTETVSVDYASEDGTAVAGTDYTAVAGTLTFTPGQVSKNIAVTAEDDAAPDGDLSFRIALSGAINGTLDTPSYGTVTIRQVTSAARNAVPGVTIIPGADDFVYETLPIVAKRASGSWEPHNMRAAAEDGLVTVNGSTGATTGVTNTLKTDWSRSMDQMDDWPNLRHGSLVVSWFGTSLDVGTCQIHPLTTYKNGSVKIWDPTYNGGLGDWKDWKWIVNGLDHTSSEISEPPTDSSSSFVYGGTPSDPGVIRCLKDLAARMDRVTFYPFLMMTSSGYPWRGRITLGSDSDDMTATAEADVATFLGTAEASEFSPNIYWQTVYYSGTSEWSYRRFILHYAHLCALAFADNLSVNLLFLIGSELRGLERIRGTGWTPAGTTGDDGRVSWDYPFVDGLIQLAEDVRGIFDAAGLTNAKIGYAADWSTWTGVKHNKTQGGESVSMDGIWPHLDQLFARAVIDRVCIDNYMPMTDWTTGTTAATNKDIGNWSAPRPTTWPPADPDAVGLGLSGTPEYSLALVEAGIEGGQGFDYYYNNSENGLMPGGETSYNDPNTATGLISRPQGDRLSQTRQAYYAGQELLAPKMLRWWWNNTHRAVYDANDGAGWAPHGNPTKWEPQSKSIVYTEYGCSATQYGTNQPNVFFDPKSSESNIPWWGTVIYNSDGNPSWTPTHSVDAMSLYIMAHASYWDLHNETSTGGVKLRDTDFDALWTWDARPYPHFPDLHSVWGDWGNWEYGHWINGKL